MSGETRQVCSAGDGCCETDDERDTRLWGWPLDPDQTGALCWKCCEEVRGETPSAPDTAVPVTAEQPSGVDSVGQVEQDVTHGPRRHGRSGADGSPWAYQSGDRWFGTAWQIESVRDGWVLAKGRTFGRGSGPRAWRRMQQIAEGKRCEG